MALEQSSGNGRGVNVLALIKGEERYVFLYDDESANEVLVQMGNYAADPELSFTWYDAAVMSQRVAKMRIAEQQHESHHNVRDFFGREWPVDDQ